MKEEVEFIPHVHLKTHHSVGIACRLFRSPWSNIVFLYFVVCAPREQQEGEDECAARWWESYADDYQTIIFYPNENQRYCWAAYSFVFVGDDSGNKDSYDSKHNLVIDIVRYS
eukprot:scaffold34595_cov160-Amphora_coffeaeformis.AAC.8